MGLPTVTPENIYEIERQLAINSGFRQPDQFVTNPKDSPPKQPPPNPELLKIQFEDHKQQATMKADVSKFQAQSAIRDRELQMEAAMRQKELQLEAQKQQMQAQNDMRERQHKAELDAMLEQKRMEFDKWKALLDAEVKLTVTQISASKATDPVATEAGDTAAQALQAILERINQPRMIVRGPDGRVAGIQ